MHQVVALLNLVAAALPLGDAFGVASFRAISSPSATSPLFVSSPRRDQTCPGWRAACPSVMICGRQTASILLAASEDDGPQDAEIVEDSDGRGATQSLLERIDSAGQKLKPMAMEAKDQSSKAAAKADTVTRLAYMLKSCSLFLLFIFYRAYRGFFVILPAVFREVYDKMQTAVDRPFNDNEKIGDEVNPETGKVRKRFRITVSILTALVTLSYVISGAFVVLGTFLKTITKTSSVEASFEAAADEMLVNEEKVKKLASNNQVNGEE